MNVSIVRAPQRPLAVHVSGELDLLTRPAVERAVAPYMSRGEPLVLDLSEVTFADVSSVRMLLALHRDADDRGWEFAVASPSAAMRFVLRLCQAEDVLPAFAVT